MWDGNESDPALFSSPPHHPPTRGSRGTNITFMLNEDQAFDLLKQAIRQIDRKYISIECHFPDDNPEIILQTERSFAYELYHHWSCLLEQQGKYLSNGVLQLSGEISKNMQLSNGVTFPDMVLHSGQNNTDNQLIVCEIKRKLDTSKQGKQAVQRDFLKLYYYLHLEPFEGCSGEPYKKAVFIALNCDLKELTEYIKELFNGKRNCAQESSENNEFERNLENIKRDADKIECIYVEPNSCNSDSITLSKILKNKSK